GWVFFDDSDNSGTPSAGEPSAVTNAQGNFTIFDLGPGPHRIREVLQPGWLQTTPNPPDLLGRSGLNISGVVFGNAPPSISIFATAQASEAGGAGTFTLTRAGATAAVTVNFTVSGTATSGVDYVALPQTVFLAAGQTSATITVSPIDDSIFE